MGTDFELFFHINVAFQGGHEQLLKMMEERMMDVEQKLRLVKRLLQDKVNQLKEQVGVLRLPQTFPIPSGNPYVGKSCQAVVQEKVKSGFI